MCHPDFPVWMPVTIFYALCFDNVFCSGRIGGSGEGMLFMSQDAGLNWTAVSSIL